MTHAIENVTSWNAADVEAWAQSRIQARVMRSLDMDIPSKAVITAIINNHK